MKSQDIVLLLKLLSLENSPEAARGERYALRQLEDNTGISKSELSSALNRCLAVALAARDRQTGLPRVNRQALLAFLLHGVKFVFPAKPAEMVRGMPTAFAAPVMASKLISAGDTITVWPDAAGHNKGQAVMPLFKSVTYAARQDPKLYDLLALVDAIRIGNARETQIAGELLQKEFAA